MAFLEIHNVAIRGISACVPKGVEDNRKMPFYAPDEVEQVIEKIGIERRHVTTINETAVDLCLKSAEKLLEDMGWEKESIDVLAFATQNPDYLNHPNSYLIHDKLGLSEHTMCLDYYHGCPSWVIGLSSLSTMMMSGNFRRILFLDGDTVNKVQYGNDREEKPLFGDAGTATALEFDEKAAPMYFNIGTLSAEGHALIRKHGGFRYPWTIETLQRELDLRSGASSDVSEVGKMDAMDVFSFAITKAPKAMKKLLSNYNLDMAAVDNMYLHQANKVIVEAIAKRMSMPMEKTPMSLPEYGNTVASSIPLTMVSERHDVLSTNHQANLVCSFGTGLSWGAAYFETDKIVCPPVQILD